MVFVGLDLKYERFSFSNDMGFVSVYATLSKNLILTGCDLQGLNLEGLCGGSQF